ncbi:MAG: hypothetical protein K8T90_15225 [Planctomycetes bacterium]|nr:hypothetical protein [Planctomycetota bacterium]
MAEKHLGELGWKALAVRHKLKDDGLAKSLATLAKLGADGDAKARLATLDDIAATAKKLRKDKAVAAVDDAAAWLDEMVKEAAKARAAAEAAAKAPAPKEKPDAAKTAKADAAQKAAPADDGGDEGDENSPDIGKRLLAGLARVKAADGEADLAFLAVPGAPAWALAVARMIAPADRKLLSESVKSPKSPVTGTCVWRDGKYTFVVPAVRGGLAAGLAGAIRHWTKKKLGVAVTDGKTTIDDANDTEEPAADGAPPTEPRVPPLRKPTAPELAVSKRSLDAWVAARTEIVTQLKAVAADLNSAEHPEKDKAVIQLGAVARQLTAQPTELRQVDELERWLKDDDVVADICDLAFDLRTPLLGALAEIRRDLTPAK